MKKFYSKALSVVAMMAAAFSAQAVNFTATPADNAEVKKLESVIISFDASKVEETNTAFPTLSNAAENFRTTTEILGVSIYKVNVMEKLTPGDYTLTIPAGTLNITDAYGTSTATNEEIKLNYTVVATPTSELNIVAEPANGATVMSLTEVKVTVEDATTVEYKPESRETMAVFYRGNEYQTGFMNAKNEGNSMTFSIDSYYTQTAGQYKLVIPEGSVIIDGKASDSDIELNYTVEGANFSIAPKADEVTELTSVVITFPSAKEIVEKVTDGVTVIGPDNETVRIYTSAKDNQFTIELVKQNELTPGMYQFTIKGGTLEVDGELYKEDITFNKLYMPELPEYTLVINPTQGSKVNGLQNFTVKFEGEDITVAIASEIDGGNAPYIYSGSERISTANVVELKDNELTIGFGAEIDAAGNYFLVIPGNLYTINGIPGIDEWINYEVVAALNYTINPKQGEVMEAELLNIEITFPEAKEIVEVGYNTTVKCGDETVLSNMTVNGNVIKFNLRGTLAAGWYTYTIPAGTLSIDGAVYDKDIVVTILYTPEEEEVSYTTVPAQGSNVDSISEIVVTFDEGAEVAVIVESTPQAPYISKGSERVTTITNVTAAANVMSIKTAAPIVEEGSYTITIPGTGYTVNGMAGQDITIDVVCNGSQSSISAISAANGQGTIYTIGGVKVAKASKGLYIINGKKVIVK